MAEMEDMEKRGPRTQRLSIPMRDGELKEVERAAYREDIPSATWARQVVLTEARKRNAAAARLKGRSRRSEMRGGDAEILEKYQRDLAEFNARQQPPPVPEKPEEPKE